MSARNPFPNGVSSNSSTQCAAWDFSLFRPFSWDAWENRGWGYTPAATRNSDLETRNWLTNLQLSTPNSQPFFPKLLGLILLIPFTTSKNYIVIAIALLTITLAVACA
jgi:hypothetical protein